MRRAESPRSVADRGRSRFPRWTLALLTAGALAALTSGCAGTPSPTSYGVTEAGSQMEFGVKMAQRGLWDEALFRFEQAAKLDRQSATGYNNMAVAQEALGRYEEALESYQRGLRLEPTNPDLKKNYARFVEFYQNFKPDDSEEETAEEDRSEEGDRTASASSEGGSGVSEGGNPNR